MNAIDIINKTKKSIELSDSEISWLVKSYTDGMIPDYQMSAWLMAVCINGLTERETLSLTYAMRDSGEIMNLDIGLTADKHSTGGGGLRSLCCKNVRQRTWSYRRNNRQAGKYFRFQNRLDHR